MEMPMGERMLLPVTGLILDWDLHPRGELVQSNLEQMIEALRAGATLPLVLVDRETRIVVDGFHRIHAYREVYGEDAQIPTLLKNYGNREEMLLETARINNAHGQKLTEKDRRRVFRIAAEMQITAEDVAAALRIRPSTLATAKPRGDKDLKLKNKPAWATQSDARRVRSSPGPRSGPRSKPSSRETVQGKEDLTLDAGYMAQQLLILIKAGPPTDKSTMDKLSSLKEAIEEILT